MTDQLELCLKCIFAVYVLIALDALGMTAPRLDIVTQIRSLTTPLDSIIGSLMFLSYAIKIISNNVA